VSARTLKDEAFRKSSGGTAAVTQKAPGWTWMGASAATETVGGRCTAQHARN